MMPNDKPPSRFVPTLTEVVQPAPVSGSDEAPRTAPTEGVVRKDDRSLQVQSLVDQLLEERLPGFRAALVEEVMARISSQP